MQHYWNWARTYSCRPKYYFEPRKLEDIEQIIDTVNKNQWKLRVIGCGHSPSSLSMSDQVLVSMKHFNEIIEIDRVKGEVHCQSGTLISTLNESLVQHRLSLPVQGSVSGITVGGAISTATHGSGIEFGTISSYLTSIKLIRLNGNIEEYRSDEDDPHRRDIFRSLACSMGTFGIILTVRLKLSDAFDLELNQHKMKFNDFLNNLSINVSSSDHFRYMWYPHTEQGIAFHLKRIEPGRIKTNKSILTRFTSSIYSFVRHSLIGHHLLEFLLYLSLPMPRIVRWINRLYIKLDGINIHRIDRCDRLFNFDCLFFQYASEWAIPVEDTVSCLVDLEKSIDQHGQVHFPIEIRFSQEDNQSYLSPCYQRKTCWINIVSYRPYGKNHRVHRAFFEDFEKICQKYNGRPHWAKENPLKQQDLAKIYPQWNLFQSIRKEFDTNNLLINGFLENLLN